MKVAIIGAGAMGCLFGSKLSLAGNDVTMIDVVPEVIHKIKDEGIILEEDGKTFLAEMKADVASNIDAEFDLIILFTKAMYSKEALDAARHIITKDTYLLSLQNGLGNDRILREYADENHAMVGVTNFPSDLLSVARVRSHKGGYVKFQSVNLKMNEMLPKVNDMFKAAGMNSSIEENIYVSIWEKAAFNAALNAICAICDVACGGVARTEDGKYLVRKIIAEAVQVAKAYDIELNEQRIIENVENSYEKHFDHYPSMAQDVHQKRKTEVEHINGAIACYGKEKNIPAPYNESLFSLLKIIEANY